MDLLAIAEQVARTGLCVAPNFLTREELLALRDDLQTIRAEKSFKRAGTGRKHDHEVRDEVRRDEIHWLDRSPAATPAHTSLWSKLDALQLTLNRVLFLGLVEFEGHYAAYPPGGFYKRHLDRFRNDDARTVSFVLYLNEAWKPEDGGQLRVYGAGDSFVDVAPRGGTLVCFLSGEKEHEVLPSQAERLSFTGWFKRSGRL